MWEQRGTLIFWCKGEDSFTVKDFQYWILSLSFLRCPSLPCSPPEQPASLVMSPGSKWQQHWSSIRHSSDKTLAECMLWSIVCFASSVSRLSVVDLASRQASRWHKGQRFILSASYTYFQHSLELQLINWNEVDKILSSVIIAIVLRASSSRT